MTPLRTSASKLWHRSRWRCVTSWRPSRLPSCLQICNQAWIKLKSSSAFLTLECKSSSADEMRWIGITSLSRKRRSWSVYINLWLFRRVYVSFGLSLACLPFPSSLTVSAQPSAGWMNTVLLKVSSLRKGDYFPPDTVAWTEVRPWSAEKQSWS